MLPNGKLCCHAISSEFLDKNIVAQASCFSLVSPSSRKKTSHQIRDTMGTFIWKSGMILIRWNQAHQQNLQQRVDEVQRQFRTLTSLKNKTWGCRGTKPHATRSVRDET